MTEAEAKLRAFAQGVFDLADWPDGGDVDGFDLQELAVTCGLLEETRPTRPCTEGDPDKRCQCEENYDARDFAESGVICYRKTKLLEGV